MRCVAAALCVVAVAATAAVGLAFAGGGLGPVIAVGALALGVGVGALVWRGTRPPDSDRRSVGAWDLGLLIVFGLASLRAFLWLIYQVGDEWRVLSPNNLGDISLHLQFIRYLAAGPAFWPESPILAGTPLVYPVGSDLWNSLLLLVGVPAERGLIWVGLVAAAGSAWALWRWGGAFALAAFLFNGGLAGFAIFQTGQMADFQAQLAWKNFFLSMFVTQRGLLFALPAGLLLLHAWRRDCFHGGSGVPAWVQLLLYATMPLFSVHTFLFLSLLLAVIWVGHPPVRRRLVRFVAGAVVPASVIMYFVTGRFAAGAGIRFLPGWMQADGGVGFWVINFGITFPLLAILGWRAWRTAEARCFVGAGFITFALALTFSFAPWEWDNMKLLLWAWLVCVPFVWEFLLVPLPRLSRSVVCFVLFFSGAVSLVGGLDGRHGYRLASRAELAATAVALAKVPPTDRIATEPDYNNPVLLLGHPVYCGYEGHLWSHGLNYRDKLAALKRLLARQPGWEKVAAEIDADWLLVRGQPPVLTPLRAGRRGPETVGR